jgi:p-aminobenzoyl-glutamate transporter AbgT
VVVADPDERRHEPVGESRGPAASTTLIQAVAFVARSSPETGTKEEIGVSQSPWHQHVSPIFFLLLVVAGLMLGFVAFFLLPEVAHAVAG